MNHIANINGNFIVFYFSKRKVGEVIANQSAEYGLEIAEVETVIRKLPLWR